LNHMARGPQRRTRMIGKSTRPIMEITGTVEITDIM
jgi:hypothetical protein